MKLILTRSNKVDNAAINRNRAKVGLLWDEKHRKHKESTLCARLLPLFIMASSVCPRVRVISEVIRTVVVMRNWNWEQSKNLYPIS